MTDRDYQLFYVIQTPWLQETRLRRTFFPLDSIVNDDDKDDNDDNGDENNFKNHTQIRHLEA